jgi:hypothetical protein
MILRCGRKTARLPGDVSTVIPLPEREIRPAQPSRVPSSGLSEVKNENAELAEKAKLAGCIAGLNPRGSVFPVTSP